MKNMTEMTQNPGQFATNAMGGGFGTNMGGGMMGMAPPGNPYMTNMNAGGGFP
jgi:hypothetical protein